MMLVYATMNDYRTYNGLDDTAALPDNIDSLLRAGSLAVRAYTSLTVYDTDPDGMPVGAGILQAFKDATCAHATALHSLDIDPDKSGVTDSSTVASKSINGASITYHKGEQDDNAALRLQVATGLAPNAKTILDMVGLNGSTPWRAG